ncbi:hypothetical protein Nepgr_010114 [Nepenthes gracilis]|uniref:Uncharacterized protein n=1 Tax=Nepenthes gracilis TaxID=150966 RepID=A0AAD3SCC0_NEPGR|nr:hypothetical protein Nepgr_010114 [Nepenthes gracilis]
MVSLLISNSKPFVQAFPTTRRRRNPPESSFSSMKPILCFDSSNPRSFAFRKIINKPSKPIIHYIKSIVIAPREAPYNDEERKRGGHEEREIRGQMGSKQMLLLCGFGYWIQGFRCFPWLALNFHMAQNLNFQPSILQLVQNSSSFPMVAKPLYGILSDALYIGGAHRIPYISIGVLLQVLSWGPLAMFPIVGDTLATLLTCVLLSNLGAAVTEVAQDALVAEYGQKHKIIGLQSYTFMAIAVAGILGNSLGGMLLTKAHPRTVLVVFTSLLLVQLAISFTTREDSLALSQSLDHDIKGKQSIFESIRMQFSNLRVALNDKNISRPLAWAVASISIVPILSGSIFCYQTQFLGLDPSIIGMCRVIGQMVLLSLTVLYDRFWKRTSIRKLITIVQFFYAASLLLDLFLVKQVNIKVGIPNDIFALCFSGLAETIATFKTVPFFVLIASLCPHGCEASLTSFLASALCLSSIISGFLGIWLASLLGITSGNYSGLPVGISLQCLAALLPLRWINSLPDSEPTIEKEWKRGESRRRRRSRRIGRAMINSIFAYRRRKFEAER